MRCLNCMKELPTDRASFCPYCGKDPNGQNTLLHRLSPGTVLHNRYLVGTTLGEGGFGITYVGFDQTLFIKVAVKEYYPSGIATRVNTVSNDVLVGIDKQKNNFANGKNSFLQEARSVAQFSRERGIVDVRDFFTENNTAYIVMEFLDGVNLNEYIYKHGVMEAKQTFEMMLPLMRSLEKMHKQNVIHRDISPDNIMYQDDGTLKLMDFGAARHFSQDESKSLSVVLKPGYAPYEQYSRKGKQGPWTDVYALCATIYKCITGETPPDSLDRAIEDDLKKPSELGVAIPEYLENALMKGLAFQRIDRLQNMEELISAIDEKNSKAIIIAADYTEDSESQAVAADDFEDGENQTVESDDTESEDKKTVAADGLENSESKTAATNDLKNYEQKTVAADTPVTEKKPVDPDLTDNTEKNVEKAKSNRRMPVIISVIAVALVLAVVGLFVVKPILDGNKKRSSYSQEELKQFREGLPKHTIEAGDSTSVGLKSDGTVVAVGSNSTGQCKVDDWNNIIAVSAGDNHTVGLKANGSVVAVGSDYDGRCSFGDRNDIVAISAGELHSVGLKDDGTVVAVGDNYKGQCDVGVWEDIVAVSAGHYHTVGLKADGTVVAVGDNNYNQCDVGDWKDIVAVSAGYKHTVGLKADGTVVAVGDNEYGKCDVGDWKNIVAISAGVDHTVGLKADGTVVAIGYNRYGQCDVSEWKDIVAVSAAHEHTVGIKADGSVVAVGSKSSHKCEVDDWNNIVAISTGKNHTVGLKSNGTAVAYGWFDNVQCDVSHWTNMKTY